VEAEDWIPMNKINQEKDNHARQTKPEEFLVI
jgi:hypothetical protein